ncbi:uncharacterized protein LOC124177860 [Neodiprion fabricii]|uniref:uncharacterized protein LOC124177860 n=1 Tax=Neodiprion fabricii TaxID=2872261 RepID=UPI001ED9170F|nr:uncharacterized protein LOC124177860 [Neodiprion fabricii]
MNSIKFGIVLCCVFIVLLHSILAKDDEDKDKLAEGEKRIRDQIRVILEHYQQEDPIGLPGAPIPDPMNVPDMKNSFSVYTMEFKDIQVYGLAKFRIHQIHANIAAMQVEIALSMEALDIRGTYTLTSWFAGSSAGNFTVKLTGVEVNGVARLEVSQSGRLQAQDIDMDLTFVNIDINFENLGLLASVFQSFLNTIGTFIFDSIKPFILKEVNTNVKGEVNKQISQLPQYFPNSISPFDMAIAEARNQVSRMGYDPYKLEDRTQSIGVFAATTSHTWVTGLASFYRMGNVTLTMKNGTVYAGIDVGTQEIEGRTHWEVSVIGGVLSRVGTVSFTVEYVRVKLTLSQPLDTRKRATLEELDLELGNVQARVHGAGTIDYLMEAGINILPNLLRYQIMDAIEGPIKRRLQSELENVDVEKLVYEKLPEIEEQARRLRGFPVEEETDLEEPQQKLTDEEFGPYSESEEERGPS